jgi:tetratricopeptide (TPR) repeat protein
LNRCPTAEQLRELLAERLGESERAALETHIETCPACQGLLTVLAGHLPPPTVCTGAPGPATVQGTCTRRLLERLKQQPAPWQAPAADAQATGPAEPPAAREARPAVAGYEILGELGKGGMGVVYRARHLGLNRLVALKMLRAGAGAGAEHLARFRTEAEAVARLQHPNIVQIHDVGEQGGLPYFSLELVEGGSLAQKLRTAPLLPHESAHLVEVLARAVHYAHEHGIIHRDLKPANVLLSAVCGLAEPKITDFGLAKKLDEEGQTQSGDILGTPSYMAPEQAQGRAHAIGPATDVYGLGVVLYECLTGRPPFRGATATATLLLVLNAEPVPPSRLQPTVPRDLETVCLTCLRKESHRRYASALELADDLARFLAGKPIRARPVGALESALKWAARRPAQAGLAAVVALATPALLALSLLYNAAAFQTERHRARERERIADLQARGGRLVDAAREALGRDRDVQEARLQLSRALALVGDEPDLVELKKRAEQVWEQTRSLLEEAAARQRAQHRYEQFLHWRDEALFHGTVFIGVDLPANSAVAGAAAERALRTFGALADSTRPLTLSRHHTAQQKAEITTGCYELLVIRAEAEARQPGADAARRALRYLQVAARLGPPTQAYHLRRARYLGRLGDSAGARAEARLADGLTPTSVTDHFLLGDEAHRGGDLAQARRHFVRALELRPGHFWAHYFLAVCQLRSGRPGDAKAHLTVCLAQRPEFAYSHLLRGVAHLQEEDHAAAEADFRKALSKEADPYAHYGALVNRGVVRFRQGKFAEATQDFQRAAALLPEQLPAHANLAQAYSRQKKWQAAEEAFARLTRLAPQTAADHRTRARLYADRGDPAAALGDYEKAIGREPPGLGEDHAERGRLLHRLGRYAEAVQAYDRALGLAPQYVAAHRCRAEALVELRRDEEAIVAFGRYRAAGKPDADVYWACGQAHARLGDHAAAVADCTQALALRPGSAPIRADRGWAYIHCQAWVLALPDFEEAIRIDPQFAPGLIGRGYVRVRQGSYRDGAEDAERALRLGPRSPIALTNLACVFAQAAARADAEPRQPDRAALAGRYRSRALGLLRDALERLPAAERPAFWRENAADPDLAPLRGAPEFAALDRLHNGPSEGKPR